MTTTHHAQRHLVKPTRRSSRFWWQPVIVLGLMALLWFQFASETWSYQTRAIPPPLEPRASYVVLTPADAAKALAGMRASWRVAEGDRDVDYLDMGMFEMSKEPAPPAFLEQGSHYPGVWQSDAVDPLPQPMPAITAAASSGAERDTLSARPLKPLSGIVSTRSKSLTDAGFTFAPPTGSLPERAGECSFYLETDSNGAITHLLVISPASGSSIILERALGRGKAKTAAKGVVTFMWSFPK